MKRRTFLLLSIFTFISKSFAKEKATKEMDVLKAVLNHLFPNTHKYKGASKFGAFEFLIFVSKHPTFDKSDFEFLIGGVKKLISREKYFLSLSIEDKEKALREFERIQYGQNWLSFVMYYGLEAMLCDPIYKGNKNFSGWKNINHTIPTPLAKSPFGKIK
jgi:gluconate 2-dehydrogenase gamma chain